MQCILHHKADAVVDKNRHVQKHGSRPKVYKRNDVTTRHSQMFKQAVDNLDKILTLNFAVQFV